MTLWGAVCTDSLLVRPCVLLAAHRALQLLKVLGVSFFSNGGHHIACRSSLVTACTPWHKCQLAASRPATSGGSISSDHMRNSKGIYCLINISGTRGGANGNTYVFSRAQSLQNQRPLCGAPPYPWMPIWLGCSDDLNLLLRMGSEGRDPPQK